MFRKFPETWGRGEIGGKSLIYKGKSTCVVGFNHGETWGEPKMSAVNLFQRSSNAFTADEQWNHAARQMSNLATAREAVKAVAPLGDHLLPWLLGEVGSHSLADREWILGTLKGAIADQRPEIPMTWLDARLPTNTRFEREAS